MCKKQTSVSHSSTESEVISLDAGLRMDGIPALDLWDLMFWETRIREVLNKEVDLGEATSFLDHVYMGCTQRQCEINKDIDYNYRTMFESRIPAWAPEKIPCSDNLRISSWSYDMEGHAKKCVERYCEVANKTTQQLYKVSTPCIDDHHFKEEELKSVGELSKVCSEIVLKCLCYVLEDLIFCGQ